MGEDDRRYDRGTTAWFTMRIAWHKRGVLLSKGLNLASGYEAVLEVLLSVGESAKELKGTRPPSSTRIWTTHHLDQIPSQHLERQAGDVLERDRERERRCRRAGEEAESGRVKY